jgi:transposase
VTRLRSDPCGSGVEVELAALRGRVTMVEAEIVTARATHDQLAAEVERLRMDNQRLRTRVDELTAQVEQLRRASKRRAAPFSIGMVVLHPRRPGRKPGMAYGRHARRPVPDPDQVSRVIDVGLPEACPHCGGALSVERVACQYQQDLPPLPATEICRYDLQIGRCQQCRRRIQPRHPEQTSQALGAAGVQVGPRAVALAAWASKAVGCGLWGA